MSTLTPDHPEFFGENPEGICSVGMAKKGGVVFREGEGKDDELLPLVALGVPETAAKVKLQFGHQVPKQVASTTVLRPRFVRLRPRCTRP